MTLNRANGKHLARAGFAHVLTLVCLSIPATLLAKPDIDIVKERVVAEILEMAVDDAEISELIRSIKDDGSWSGINYTDLSLTGFEHRLHLRNLEHLSLAYNKRSSSFYNNPTVLELVNRSLSFWCDRDFIAGNWYHNQVSTPKSLVNVLLLMDSHIVPELKARALRIIGRAHLNAPGARPGADRIRIGGIAAKRELVVGDELAFGGILKVINQEVKFDTGDRGMQHDYSFHHRFDRVNTTYSYGTSYAEVFAEWAAYVAGTKYALTRDKVEQLIDYYLDGICKQAVYGIYLETGSLNRSISRKGTFEPISIRAPEQLLMASGYRKDELEKIIALRQGRITPTDSFARFFWQSEHFVYQRPGFFTSVRMFSIRNQNMEQPHNSEGILNHHRGDGTNHLSVRGNEYLNIWPVYDWQKIPGTTILQKPELPPADKIQMTGVTGFVGAVTDGTYGAVAFDFISPHDFTRARKGWFFFDDEYVCLGAGIESPSRKLPVVTTVNQALLNGEVMVSNTAGVDTLNRGVHQIDDAKWVFHDGTGYIFPRSTAIHVSNRQQTGRWTDISKQSNSPKELVEEDVFALWIDHGVRPQGNIGESDYASAIPEDVKYQYIVVPVTRPDRMNDDRGITILENSRRIQAVYNQRSGIVQAVFYHAGRIDISPGVQLSLDSPGAVMLKMAKGKVTEITAADPSRNLDRMHLRVSGMEDLTIEMPGGVYAGQSVITKP